MKKSLLLFCAILCMAIFSSCSSSEPEIFCTLYGSVTDKVSGEPIRNATITLSPGGKTTVSGSDGVYQFDDLDPGQYRIQVQKEGYETNYKTATAVTGNSVRADIPLAPIQQ